MVSFLQPKIIRHQVAKLCIENVLLLHTSLEMADLRMMSWQDSDTMFVGIANSSYGYEELAMHMLITGSCPSDNKGIPANVGQAVSDMLDKLTRRVALFAPTFVEAMPDEILVHGPRHTTVGDIARGFPIRFRNQFSQHSSANVHTSGASAMSPKMSSSLGESSS